MIEENDFEVMKAIIHNKILLMVILSLLGLEDDEIDDLNQSIYNSLEALVKELIDKEQKEN